ncbi:MAG TPA: DUF4091 domain-containing protein [Candidatus Bathyarchaeia archaeon]|nr:DUF4091 domain-containing protein [Candidatus Bathyarchaeia archaeon]
MVCSLLALAAGGVIVGDEVRVEGDYLTLLIAPGEGGAIAELGLRATVGNFAGQGGLLMEGFGVGSYYVPNRRLNEQLEVDEAITERPVLYYSYDCDGPNIRGLHVIRTMEPIPDEASIRVQWKVVNKGDESQWIAPWVRNSTAPGGKFSTGDRIDIPTRHGIIQADHTGYYTASRNWISATDPIEQNTIYAVFNANQTHSFLTLWEPDRKRSGFHTAFVPQMLEPGGVWETTYRLNAVRGLKHVDFASDEIAVQIDYKPGQLVLLVATAKVLKNVHIHTSIVAENGRVWKLPAKRFDIDPNRVVRCAFDWTAPGPGVYDLLARLSIGSDQPLPLGLDTAPPHEGIDTQFVVGSPGTVSMEPWTDAPFALDRGPRTLERTLAYRGDTAIWFEHSLEKIFREDVPKPLGQPDPVARIQLAHNERESFQIVIRPPADTDLFDVDVHVSDLIGAETSATIPARHIRVANVAYCPIRIPSYFEGPTGEWPDALPPFQRFTARGARCSPVWVTVYAPLGIPPGVYRGPLVITAVPSPPIHLTIEATVYGFDLPMTPALKTDFGFWPQNAHDAAQAQGCTLSRQGLIAQFVANAAEHRVTLREPAQFPAASTSYADELRRFEPRLKELRALGATTFSVPAALLDSPGQLELANAFVAENALGHRAFCQIASEPLSPEWPKLVERMHLWQDLAPTIPLMVTTRGLQPFLAAPADIWAVHTPVLDTLNNKPILERIQEGKEVWWYVNHSPPRPYANFFVDFAGIEHRILFWQAWALGIAGVHYWSVSYCMPGQDPYLDQGDVTPVNGDGLLVYPGKDGPVDSIRWEIIRDGIEDYDYLTILKDRMRRVSKAGGHEALLERAAEACDLKELVPDLVTFPRDPDRLEAKRSAIAQMIVELDQAL